MDQPHPEIHRYPYHCCTDDEDDERYRCLRTTIRYRIKGDDIDDRDDNGNDNEKSYKEIDLEHRVLVCQKG